MTTILLIILKINFTILMSTISTTILDNFVIIIVIYTINLVILNHHPRHVYHTNRYHLNHCTDASLVGDGVIAFST